VAWFSTYFSVGFIMCPSELSLRSLDSIITTVVHFPIVKDKVYDNRFSCMPWFSPS
jgi:hypothetical protein